MQNFRRLLLSSLFIFIMILLIPEYSKAEHFSQPLIIEDHTTRESLYPATDLIKDRENNISITDLVEDERLQDRFKHINLVKQKRGFFYSPNWLRFDIKNDSTSDDWLIEFAFPLIHELQLYTVEGERIEKLYDTGANFPFDNRPIKHRHFVFDLNINPGETKTYYAYAVGSGDLHPPILIWNEDRFLEKTQRESILLGIFYGITLVMIVYNLFLYFSLRMKSYLFYVLMISFTLLGKLSINGIGFQYLWPNFPDWNIISTTFWVATASIFILIFTRYFLEVDKYVQSFKYFYYIFICFNLSVMVFVPISRYISLYLMILAAISSFLTVIITASICLYRGAREARFYLLGWLVFLSGVSITMLERAVVLPYSLAIEYAGQAAISVEVILLSLALADKINIMRSEKEEAEQKALQNKELALQNLRKSDELKDEFLAVTSHELRTPLYGMIGIAESLRDGVAGYLPEKVKHQLTMISDSGRRLTELVNDILDFSKLRYDSLNLNLKHVNIQSVLPTVITILNPLLEKKPIKLINLIDEDTPAILADEDRLQQILYNLIENAIKYTEVGSITIHATTLNNELALHITDSGKGMTTEQLDVIFQPFQQGDISLSREVGGVGIGLNIAKSLVELHNGQLDVVSEINQGTTFTITLPLSKEKDYKGASIQTKQPIKQSSNVLQFPQPKVKEQTKILVVDDEIVNVQVLMNQLTLEGYEVVTTLDGNEVFDLVRKEDFDLIILDIMMPGISGYEVAQHLRKKYSMIELPILMLTAKSQVQDKMLAFEAGANDYLIKPCDKQELLSRARTLIRAKKLNDKIMNMNAELEDKVLERTKELKIANDHLQELAHSRRQLLANIAHELGTPVTVINQYIQSIQKQIISIDHPQYTKLVKDKISVLNRLIGDLFDLSVLESEKVHFNLERRPLKESLERLCKNSSLITTQKNRQFLECDFPPNFENYDIYMDEARLEQLFSNLIFNAIKYTEEKTGTISIDVQLIERHNVQIAITDNGKGIDKESLPYIFERFYKEQTPHSEAGTGLGLAIAKQIVENHEGNIWVDSEKGVGTTFYISLPIELRTDHLDRHTV